MKVLINTEMFLDGKSLKKPVAGGHYSAEIPWRLNPGLGYVGHFAIEEEIAKGVQNSKYSEIKVKVFAIIIDQYERQHKLLPVIGVMIANPIHGTQSHKNKVFVHAMSENCLFRK